MKRLLTILTIVLTISCYGQDFSVEDCLTQTVNAENINYLIIECYCDNGVEINKKLTETINIDITGKLESVGYHGIQNKPEEIGEKILFFKTEIKNDTLRLLSKEWTFMHHSFLIDKLIIQIPERMKHEIIKINGQKLEGREIE